MLVSTVESPHYSHHNILSYHNYPRRNSSIVNSNDVNLNPTHHNKLYHRVELFHSINLIHLIQRIDS